MLNSSRLSLVLLEMFWKTLSWIGLRRIAKVLQRHSAYHDTIFYFHNAPTGYIALTIDDGLSRSKDSIDDTTLQELLNILQQYKAHATFFVCTDYLMEHHHHHRKNQVCRMLLDKGHEIGNHMQRDVSGYYHTLDETQFRQEVEECNQILCKAFGLSSVKWFRAPQGRMTFDMARVIGQLDMKHVLGDCYCDDWAFAEYMDRCHNNATRRSSVNQHTIVPKLMLQHQVHKSGSIAIFHMPECRFRTGCLGMIREFVKGAKECGLQCVSLSELEELSVSSRLS